MGTKHPDIVCPPPNPIRVHTIGQMKAARWRLTATCTRCRVRLWVDVDSIVRALGPDAFFWVRTARCRVWTWGDRERCPGSVVFAAQSVTGGSWVPLARSDGAVRSWQEACALRDGRNPDDWKALASYDPFARTGNPGPAPDG